MEEERLSQEGGIYTAFYYWSLVIPWMIVLGWRWLSGGNVFPLWEVLVPLLTVIACSVGHLWMEFLPQSWVNKRHRVYRERIYRTFDTKEEAQRKWGEFIQPAFARLLKGAYLAQVCFFGALKEEMLFRAPLLALPRAEQDMRWILALVFNILFGLVHAQSLKVSMKKELDENTQKRMLPLLPMLRVFHVFWAGAWGVLWAWMTIRTGNVLAAFLVHSVSNFPPINGFINAFLFVPAVFIWQRIIDRSREK